MLMNVIIHVHNVMDLAKISVQNVLKILNYLVRIHANVIHV